MGPFEKIGENIGLKTGYIRNTRVAGDLVLKSRI